MVSYFCIAEVSSHLGTETLHTKHSSSFSLMHPHFSQGTLYLHTGALSVAKKSLGEWKTRNRQVFSCIYAPQAPYPAHFFSSSSCGCPSVQKYLNGIGLEPTQLTPHQRNHLFKGPVSTFSHILRVPELRIPSHNLGNMIQSLRVAKDPNPDFISCWL